MLISLKNNKWLLDWMKDKWREPFTEIFNTKETYLDTPTSMLRQMGKILTDNGYTIKYTSGGDIIISMTEEEFIFLKLKYS
jgi:hypothetical protein